MSKKMMGEKLGLAPIICGVCGRSFDTFEEFGEHSCMKRTTKRRIAG